MAGRGATNEHFFAGMIEEAMEIYGEQKIQRKHSIYQSLDEKFEIRTERYKGQQYSQIYFARLHNMRNLLYALIPKWKPHLPVNTVLGLEQGKECFIVGTLYKHMKLKPSILDEYSKERSAVPLVHPHNFMHPDDHLILEDESGRVKLAGDVLAPSVFVTGIVVALHGKETGDGDFLVQDILEASLPPQIPLALGSKDDKYVVFVSGLGVGNSKSNPLQFQLLVDHITGHLGDEKVFYFVAFLIGWFLFKPTSSMWVTTDVSIEQEQAIASQIVRVIIAGNSVEIAVGFLTGQSLASKDQSKLFEPIKELDISLIQLAAAMPVDIMPGPCDPANFSLPQQPLHKCLFPGTSVYNTFMSCTNPHSFELDDVRFLGTSGQNIDDLEKYSDAKDKLDFMERTLRWRHLAPTAPNTLGCYPFSEKDPFLIESCPHVYFIGNQKKYETRLLQGSEGQLVRLICIPRFCETGVAVVLNIRNLECHTLSFSTELDLQS